MKKSFTLIELLVVVSIIGVLAAMLFPALGRARDKAQVSNCRSNLKNIGNALRIYHSDGDTVNFQDRGGSNFLTSNHSWTSAYSIDPALLKCPAKREGNSDGYEIIVATNISWNNIITEPDSTVMEDETVHINPGKVNHLKGDGSVQSQPASN